MNSAEADISFLYRQNVTMLRLTCTRLLGDKQLAEDVVQEAFIKYIAYSKRTEVSRPSSVLYCIAVRLATSKIRSRKKSLPVYEHLIPDGRQRAPDDRIAIYKILQKVDEEEAEVAIMHFIEGLSQDEIAEVMGLARRTIGNRLLSFCRRAAKVLGPAERPAHTDDENYDIVSRTLARQA